MSQHAETYDYASDSSSDKPCCGKPPRKQKKNKVLAPAPPPPAPLPSKDKSDSGSEDEGSDDNGGNQSRSQSGGSDRCCPKKKPKPCPPKPCPPPPPPPCPKPCTPSLECRELLWFWAQKKVRSVSHLLLPVCLDGPNGKQLPDKLWTLITSSKDKAARFFKRQVKCANLDFSSDNIVALLVNPKLGNTFVTSHFKGKCTDCGKCCGPVYEAFWAYIDLDAGLFWQFGFWFITSNDSCGCPPRTLHYRTNCASRPFPSDDDILTSGLDCRCPQNCHDFTTDLLVFDFCAKRKGSAKVTYSFARTCDCKIQVNGRTFIDLACKKKVIVKCSC